MLFALVILNKMNTNTQAVQKPQTQQPSGDKNSTRRGGQNFKKRYNSQSHRKHTERKQHKHIPIPEIQGDDIRVIPIGGVEQIGQNMNIVETKDDIFVIDIGIQFSSEEETPGVDLYYSKHKISCRTKR